MTQLGERRTGQAVGFVVAFKIVSQGLLQRRAKAFQALLAPRTRALFQHTPQGAEELVATLAQLPLGTVETGAHVDQLIAQVQRQQAILPALLLFPGQQGVVPRQADQTVARFFFRA